MKITILGCGGAAGVPGISMGWGRCDPNEARNRRRRAAILVESAAGTRLLVDTPPDLRAQLLDAGVRRLDAVVWTHDHADHLHGLDDLREINRVTRAFLPAWGSAEMLATARERFGYAFEPLDPGYQGVIYRPMLEPRIVAGPFPVGDLMVRPFDQDHGYCRSLGLRIGDAAYCTDVVEFPEDSLPALEGLDLLIVGCLVDEPHPTHADVGKVLAWVERFRPRRTVLTHMGSRLDYQTLRRRLPPGVEPAHDGMVLELPDPA
jgi:phosphoribosyl 1,2-cyclic phosphate phosphodiesterase